MLCVLSLCLAQLYIQKGIKQNYSFGYNTKFIQKSFFSSFHLTRTCYQWNGMPSHSKFFTKLYSHSVRLFFNKQTRIFFCSFAIKILFLITSGEKKSHQNNEIDTRTDSLHFFFTLLFVIFFDHFYFHK